MSADPATDDFIRKAYDELAVFIRLYSDTIYYLREKETYDEEFVVASAKHVKSEMYRVLDVLGKALGFGFGLDAELKIRSEIEEAIARRLVLEESLKDAVERKNEQLNNIDAIFAVVCDSIAKFYDMEK